MDKKEADKRQGPEAPVFKCVRFYLFVFFWEFLCIASIIVLPKPAAIPKSFAGLRIMRRA